MDAVPENKPTSDSGSQPAECVIELPRLSPSYRITVLFVCVAMVLLPLIYFAFAAAVGSSVVYFAVHYYFVLIKFDTLGEIAAFVPFYVIGLMGGTILTLLLIK